MHEEAGPFQDRFQFAIRTERESQPGFQQIRFVWSVR
jgi:hypothetical protein